jgi:hypothetical protein
MKKQVHRQAVDELGYGNTEDIGDDGTPASARRRPATSSSDRALDDELLSSAAF